MTTWYSCTLEYDTARPERALPLLPLPLPSALYLPCGARARSESLKGVQAKESARARRTLRRPSGLRGWAPATPSIRSRRGGPHHRSTVLRGDVIVIDTAGVPVCSLASTK